MSEKMTQEDAMKMDNRQAAELLKPLRDMMIDQNGCPISSAVFALDKAIEALTADVRENIKGEWIDCGIHGDWAWEQDGHGNCWHIWKCSKCEYKTDHRSNYCPNCGCSMKEGNNERS